MIFDKIVPSKSYKTTVGVAEKLVQMCRQNKRWDALDELYSDKITSLEIKAGKVDKTEGKSEVLRKISDWNAYVEQIFDFYIADPIINGNYFSCNMVSDILTKDMERVRINEAYVYKVQEGKIVIEQFLVTIN